MSRGKSSRCLKHGDIRVTKSLDVMTSYETWGRSKLNPSVTVDGKKREMFRRLEGLKPEDPRVFVTPMSDPEIIFWKAKLTSTEHQFFNPLTSIKTKGI